MEFLSVEIIAILFFVALIAGFIDTLAGGGGLLTIPALILTGMSPISVLGTNKFQAFIGTLTATSIMFYKKKITFSEVKHIMLYAFIGSFIGTVLVQFINAEILSFVIPFALFFIGIYFLFMPKSNDIDREARISEKKYRFFIVPSIGFYDGVFGPGTGSFFALSGIALRGYNIIKATIFAKSMNFATNIASVIVFLAYGHIVFVVGVVMMLGQFIGAYLGANTLFKINPNHLRFVVVVMCFLMLLKYVYQMGWISL